MAGRGDCHRPRGHSVTAACGLIHPHLHRYNRVGLDRGQGWMRGDAKSGVGMENRRTPPGKETVENMEAEMVIKSWRREKECTSLRKGLIVKGVAGEGEGELRRALEREVHRQ